MSSHDAMVYVLSKTCQNLLENAHSIAHLALGSSKARTHYNNLIYSAIKTLSATLKLSNLDPATEVSILLRLSQIYAQETNNIAVSEACLTKALAIASRISNLDFQTECIAAEMIANGPSRVALKYLNSKIDSFNQSGKLEWAQLFQLLRNNLLISVDPKAAVSSFKNFNSGDSLSPLQHYSLIIEANVCIYRGELDRAKLLLESLQKLGLSSHLKVMLVLNLILYSLYKFNIEDCKNYIAEANRLMGNEIKTNLQNWPSDGYFIIPVGDQNFRVSWLALEEVQSVLWLYSGICHLHGYQHTNKAEKYLQTALSLIDKFSSKLESSGLLRRSQESLSINQLSNTLIRLKFFRFQVRFYLCYFHHVAHKNDSNGSEHLLAEIQNDLQSLSSLEQSYFKGPMTKNIYLLALIHQSRGQLNSAKYYYTKLREFCSRPNISAKMSQLSYSCSIIGLGSTVAYPENQRAQLYAFSTFNSLLICQFELKNSSGEALESLTNERDNLLQDISKISDSQYLVEKTKPLFDVYFNEYSFQQAYALLRKEDQDISTISDLNLIATFLLGVFAEDLQIKKALFQQCLENSKNTGNKAIQLFIEHQLRQSIFSGDKSAVQG